MKSAYTALDAVGIRAEALNARYVKHVPGRKLASDKNRLHKALTDGGIRLDALVSDVHDQSARAMMKALIAGQSPQTVLQQARRCPCAMP